MNTKQQCHIGQLSTALALALCIGFSYGNANAQTSTNTEDHKAHHPETQPTESKKEASKEMGMMGTMDMEQMHTMMSECLKSKK